MARISVDPPAASATNGVPSAVKGGVTLALARRVVGSATVSAVGVPKEKIIQPGDSAIEGN